MLLAELIGLLECAMGGPARKSCAVETNPAGVPNLALDSLGTYLGEARALRDLYEDAPIDAVWLTARLQDSAAIPWPSQPTPPPSERSHRDANDLIYPTSLLVYTFVGLDSVEVTAEYRQDWVHGNRVLLRIPRSQWIAYEDLPPIEEQG